MRTSFAKNKHKNNFSEIIRRELWNQVLLFSWQQKWYSEDIGHCNACVVFVVVVMWPLSVACCGQVPTPVPMKDILAIKFDINMVKTRNKYFKLNTTCASCNWKLNKNCVTMMIFRQFDLQLATESLRPVPIIKRRSRGFQNTPNLRSSDYF